jgi:hypothetical protein
VAPPPLVRLRVGLRTHLAVEFSDWTLCGVRIDKEPEPGFALMCRYCTGLLPEEADMNTPVRVGSFTPWGRADFAEVLAPGIVTVGTPSHGGIHLDPEQNARVHPVWRATDGWYEEDCESYIVLATFPETAAPYPLEKVHDSLAYWLPSQHAVAFPVESAKRGGRQTVDDAMRELRARAEAQQA